MISTEEGQLNGRGLEGFYMAGRRILSRCQVRVAGREPLAMQARMLAADRARFVGTLRASPDAGPDPDLVVERTRDADGTERITLRSSAPRALRLPVEAALGTDLAELGDVASGRAGPELPASVHASGLRWSCPTGYVTVTADPPPTDALASAGLLRWELELPPGGTVTVELRVRPDGQGPIRAVGSGSASPFAEARVPSDEPGVEALLRTCVDDLRALLLRDPRHPADTHLAAGAPWRCGLAPAEALAAARMTLPLGTRLAAGTLRTLARTQLAGPGPRSGLIPGPLRDSGPHLPPGCILTIGGCTREASRLSCHRTRQWSRAKRCRAERAAGSPLGIEKQNVWQSRSRHCQTSRCAQDQRCGTRNGDLSQRADRARLTRR